MTKKNQQSEDRTYVAGLLRRLEIAKKLRRYDDLPDPPRTHLANYYFVGSFEVRSHWRTRPRRK